MLRSLIGLTATVILCASAGAQTEVEDQAKPKLPPDAFKITNRTVVGRPPLIREYRAEYLARQLSLTKEQREQYAGAVQTILMTKAPQLDLERVRMLYNQMNAAQKQKDPDKVAKLLVELEQIGQTQRKEPEFVDNVKKFISPAQGRILDEQIARLGRNPSGALRPVDVFDYLDAAELSAEQREKLAVVRKEFRMTSTKSARKDGGRRSQLLRGLLRKCNAILNESQKKEFMAFTERMRPDYVPNIERMDGAINKLGKRAGQPKRP